MIDNKTVFIIGAGASKPYNFPTGRELRRDIVTNLENHIRPYFTNPISSNLDFPLEGFTFLANRFNNSGIFSIDRFLAFNPNLSDIGKFAIALEILRAESQSKFDELMEPDLIGFDWYSFVFNRMLEGISPGEGGHLEFATNKISFVTFNYDRSLEWYLYRSFVNTFNEKYIRANTVSKLIPFPFLHVYGAAKLAWEEESPGVNSVDYQQGREVNKIRIGDIKAMAESIKIIRENRNREKKIDEIIADAERVFFLGFSYADENLDVLNIPENIEGKRVFGTTMGLTDRQIQRILRKLSSNKKNSSSNIRQINRGFRKNLVELLKVDYLTLLTEFL